MTVAYLDANALISIQARDDGGDVAARVELLVTRGFGLLSSALTALEIRRYLHRQHSSDIDRDADGMLGGTVTVPISDAVLQVGGSLAVQHLGALDALHLATALLVRADVLVTRDRQLARAATAVGVSVL